jgi:hypothetical protein
MNFKNAIFRILSCFSKTINPPLKAYTVNRLYMQRLLAVIEALPFGGLSNTDF